MSYVRCSSETHKKLKILAAARGVPMQDLIEEAAALVLGETSPNPKAPSVAGIPAIPSETLPVVEWLIGFMSRRGNPEQESLKATLRVLAAQRTAQLKQISKQKKNAS
jgi:hypothetical protein